MSKTAPSSDKWAAIRDRGAVVVSKAARSREEFEELSEELACEFFVLHNRGEVVIPGAAAQL